MKVLLKKALVVSVASLAGAMFCGATAFADTPDAQTTRDLAYVAQRKAPPAEALAAQALENTSSPPSRKSSAAS